MKNILLIIVIVVVIVSGLFLFGKGNPQKDLAADQVIKSETEKKVVVYKSPSCGCCVGYSQALEEHGFEVEIMSINDMRSIKDQYNIPRDMESCHTTVIGDYFIEGHVPLEVVDKLLSEKPAISGIALPNMPAGTPGMPGVKDGPYTIFQLTEGQTSEFITL